MKRGTKEFYEVMEAFERSVRDLSFGPLNFVPCDFRKDEGPQVYYANGVVNQAFRAFMCGYSYARCKYLIGEGE